MMGAKSLVVCRGSGQAVRGRTGAKGICSKCGRRCPVRPDGKARNHKAWVKV